MVLISIEDAVFWIRRLVILAVFNWLFVISSSVRNSLRRLMGDSSSLALSWLFSKSKNSFMVQLESSIRNECRCASRASSRSEAGTNHAKQECASACNMTMSRLIQQCVASHKSAALEGKNSATTPIRESRFRRL